MPPAAGEGCEDEDVTAVGNAGQRSGVADAAELEGGVGSTNATIDDGAAGNGTIIDDGAAGNGTIIDDGAAGNGTAGAGGACGGKSVV